MTCWVLGRSGSCLAPFNVFYYVSFHFYCANGFTLTFYSNEMMLGQFTFSLNVPRFIDVKSVMLLTFSNIKAFLDLEI